MGDRLKGKVALITGGTSGIGEATVARFVEEGARVVFTGRSAESGAKIESRHKGAAVFFKADVLQEADIKASVDKTVETFGRIDCLFNNAGGPTGGTLETVTREHFDHGMMLLLGSVIFAVKYAVPVMKAQNEKQPGHCSIINNSSLAAIRTDMGGYLYSAAKAAVTHLTHVQGLELAPFGITVNAISPGSIATPIFYGGSSEGRKLEPAHGEAKMAKLKRNLSNVVPLGRAGLPEDIANAALFLASDEGSYVTCLDMVVDGGVIWKSVFQG